VVVVLSAVLLRDRPRPVAVVCVVVATVGTALTIGPVQGGQVVGVLLALGSALAYALYILGNSRVKGVGPFATAATVMSACAVVYGTLGLVTRPQLPSTTSAWVALVGVALIGTVVAVTTFFGALALLGPSDTSVVSTVEPVVSVGVAALVLGEVLSPLQLAGGVLVLIAVGVLARVGSSRPATGQEVPA
jgi:drug/metabolite transporter (DMT)-like permease